MIQNPVPIEHSYFHAASEPTRRPARTVVLVAGLLLLVAVAYANAIDHPFVYDDSTIVLGNPQIRSLSNLPEVFGFTDEGFAFRSRWTRNATHALEYAAAGFWSPLYHATNVALHGLVAVLTFLLAWRVSENRAVGWWTAALFAVHPITTDVVSWVSGRRGLLAALFSVVTLLLLERFTSRGGAWRLGVAAVTFYLAVFSKQHAVMTPVVFIAIDLFRNVWRPAGGGRAALSRIGAHLRVRGALYAGLLACAAGAAALLLFAITGARGLAGSAGFYDTSWHGLDAIHRASLVGLALRLLLIPVGQTVDYSYDALGFVSGAWLGLGLINLTILGVAVAIAAYGFWRGNWAGLGGAWFLAFYAPHLGIVPWHEIFAERFLYLPSIGFFFAVAAGAVAVARKAGPRRLAIAAGAVALVLLAAGTHLRNRVWGSELELWHSAVERYPSCARAHKALGRQYLAELRPDLALQHFEEATRILPTFLDAHVQTAVALVARGDFAEAMDKLDEIGTRWPTVPAVWNLRGYIHQTLGRPELALASYEQAVEHDPTFAEGYNNIARLYVERGDVAGAVEMYERALELDPAFVNALRNLAVVYRHAYGDEEKAAFYESQAEAIADSRSLVDLR